jgi:hypothetical protein
MRLSRFALRGAGDESMAAAAAIMAHALDAGFTKRRVSPQPNPGFGVDRVHPARLPATKGCVYRSPCGNAILFYGRILREAFETGSFRIAAPRADAAARTGPHRPGLAQARAQRALRAIPRAAPGQPKFICLHFQFRP